MATVCARVSQGTGAHSGIRTEGSGPGHWSHVREEKPNRAGRTQPGEETTPASRPCPSPGLKGRTDAACSEPPRKETWTHSRCARRGRVSTGMRLCCSRCQSRSRRWPAPPASLPSAPDGWGPETRGRGRKGRDPAEAAQLREAAVLGGTPQRGLAGL